MSKIVLMVFLLFGISANAEVLLGLGGSARFVKNDEDNFEAEFPILAYGGYRNGIWIYAIEGLYYQNKSDAGSSFVTENNHFEATLYALRFIKYQDGRAINLYAVGGLGGFQERIETNFSGVLYKDKSQINAVVKAGGGAWADLGPRGFINLEVKGLYSRDFSPEFLFDVVTRIGTTF